VNPLNQTFDITDSGLGVSEEHGATKVKYAQKNQNF